MNSLHDRGTLIASQQMAGVFTTTSAAPVLLASLPSVTVVGNTIEFLATFGVGGTLAATAQFWWAANGSVFTNPSSIAIPASSSAIVQMTLRSVTFINAGTYAFQVYWAVSAGTATIDCNSYTVGWLTAKYANIV